MISKSKLELECFQFKIDFFTNYKIEMIVIHRCEQCRLKIELNCQEFLQKWFAKIMIEFWNRTFVAPLFCL